VKRVFGVVETVVLSTVNVTAGQEPARLESGPSGRSVDVLTEVDEATTAGTVEGVDGENDGDRPAFPPHAVAPTTAANKAQRVTICGLVLMVFTSAVQARMDGFEMPYGRNGILGCRSKARTMLTHSKKAGMCARDRGRRADIARNPRGMSRLEDTLVEDSGFLRTAWAARGTS
jgi:hypothetical protein